jgi:threonine synthase
MMVAERSDFAPPRRTDPARHKGHFGHLAIVLGQKEGAAILAARAAQRFGTGLVTLLTDTPVTGLDASLMQSDALPDGTTALALGAPDRALCYVVPTGNFGDIFAGFVAQQMGLPIDRLVIATNINDIQHRALTTGSYEVAGAVKATSSPSMDIQISSNFERLLFEAVERDAAVLKSLMDQLQQSGGFDIPEQALAWIRQLFASGKADEEDVARTISGVLEDTGELVDPHTAVGLHVARDHISAAHAVIALATAHPAKFPETIARVAGIRPPLPDHHVAANFVFKVS